jgi:hypothetical protein
MAYKLYFILSLLCVAVPSAHSMNNDHIQYVKQIAQSAQDNGMSQSYAKFIEQIYSWDKESKHPVPFKDVLYTFGKIKSEDEKIAAQEIIQGILHQYSDNDERFKIANKEYSLQLIEEIELKIMYACALDKEIKKHISLNKEVDNNITQHNRSKDIYESLRKDIQELQDKVDTLEKEMTPDYENHLKKHIQQQDKEIKEKKAYIKKLQDKNA